MSKLLLSLKEPTVKRSLGILLLLLCCCAPAWSQEQLVRGRITDDTGGGMPGVNVLLKGTSIGTTTDADGRYSIAVPAGDATLVYSFIGYLSQEQAVGSRSNIDVVLAVDVTELAEVVVVGYGTQEKRDITAAISSIDQSVIQKIPSTNPLDAMKGQIAGVDVLQASGRPGQAASITIRGRRSINASNDPLIVVDGVPMTSGTGGTYRYDAAQGKSVKDTDQPGTVGLQDFNPSDIESIEVLKDAAATAIYGSRGANGVVLITTKRGKAGKTTISYTGSYGMTEEINRFPVMNGEEFANLKREASRLPTIANNFRSAWNGALPADNLVFIDPVELNSVTKGLETDWQDLIFQKGSQLNQQVSVNGGSEKTQFNVSLGYFKEEGIIKTMEFEKVTARVNVDHQINKIFKIGTSTLLSHSLEQRGGGNAALTEAVNQTPLGLPYDTTPGGIPETAATTDPNNPKLIFLPIQDGIRSNPLSELVPGKRYDDRGVDRVFASVYLEANILKDLKYKLLLGTDIGYNTNGTFDGQFTNSRRTGTPSASYTNERNRGYTIENLLTYNKRINEYHEFGATFLQSIQGNSYERHFTSVADLPYESQKWYNLASAPTLVAKESILQEWQLASVMGRVNYSYRGKYLVQATLRADGSSRLSPGNKWTNFPGLSVGWRISDESFMAKIPVLNELKLRASYGQVGNTSVDPYQTTGRLQADPTRYSWDETSALGLRLIELPNPNLTWEKSATVDIGLDFGLFQSRLHGSVDIYETNTTDLLLRRNLPITAGYEFILSNVGATRTRGYEVTLGSTNFDTPGGFRWTTDFNIAHYKEEIVDLAQRDAEGNKTDDTGNAWFIGQPIRVFYQYNKIGIWQKDEAALAAQVDQAYPGEIKVEDTDGSGTISPSDRKVLGNDVPKAYGGLTNNFSFKGIDFSFFLYYRLGFMLDSRFEDTQATMQARYNNIKVDYWTIDNPSNEYPRPNKNQEFPQRRETLRYRDGGFVKLRNVTLAYNFPKSITERMKVNNLRVYVTTQNAFIWSKYKVYDPESINQIETGDIPPTRLFLGGVNLTF